MIDVSCVCGKTYSVPDDKAGRKLQCRRCGTVQRVPRARKPESDPVLVPFQMPGATDWDDELRAPSAELPLELKAPLRRCPSCGTQDDPSVVICVRCGYDFRSRRRLDDAHDEATKDSRRRAKESGGRALEHLTRLAWVALSPLGVALGPYVFARSLKVEKRMRALRSTPEEMRQVQQARLLGSMGMVAWLLVILATVAFMRGKVKGGAVDALTCRARLEQVGRVVRERVRQGPFPADGDFPVALRSLQAGDDASLNRSGLQCPMDQDLYSYKRRPREILTVDTPGDYLILWDDPSYPHSDELGAIGFRALRFDGTVETFKTRAALETALRRAAYSQTATVDADGGVNPPRIRKPPRGGGKGSDADGQAALFLDFAGECEDDDPDLTQFVDPDHFLDKVGVPADVLLPVLFKRSSSDRVREAAARMLARVELPIAEKLELAVSGLGDPLAGVRLGTGIALQQVGDPRWVRVLAGVVEDGEPDSAAIAERVLGREAVKSKEVTREILIFASETRARIGAQGDDAIVPLPSAALPHVVALLQEGEVGREAEAVLYSAEADGLEAVLKILASPDVSLRRVAFRCLNRLRIRGILSLVEFLDHLNTEPDAAVRATAIDDLSQDRDHPTRDLADWALAALRSGREPLDRPCRRIIARVGLPTASPPRLHAEGLSWLLDDLSREGEVGALLSELGASSRLLDELLDEQIEQRWSSFPPAVRLGLTKLATARLNQASLLVLLKGAADESVEVRQAALGGLAKSGAPQSKTFRKAVSRLLSSRLRGETDAKARESLFRLARGTRYCAVGEKGQDHRCDSALYRTLKGLVTDGDRRAMQTLTTHPNYKAVGLFQELLASGDQYLAIDAGEALRTLTGIGLMTPTVDAWGKEISKASGRVKLKLRKEAASLREQHDRADERARERLEKLRQSR